MKDSKMSIIGQKNNNDVTMCFQSDVKINRLVIVVAKWFNMLPILTLSLFLFHFIIVTSCGYTNSQSEPSSTSPKKGASRQTTSSPIETTVGDQNHTATTKKPHKKNKEYKKFSSFFHLP